LSELQDQMTAAKVKTELNIDEELKNAGITVECVRGVVHLRGTVASEALRQRATRAARRVQTVLRVVNELEVKA